MFVMAGYDDNSVFGKVPFSFVASGILSVVAERLETVEVARHGCCHLVLTSGKMLNVLIVPKFKSEYYPLDSYAHKKYRQVVPRFEIFA